MLTRGENVNAKGAPVVLVRGDDVEDDAVAVADGPLRAVQRLSAAVRRACQRTLPVQAWGSMRASVAGSCWTQHRVEVQAGRPQLHYNAGQDVNR